MSTPQNDQPDNRGIDASEPLLGRRVRALRTRRRMTLEQLADKVQLSKGHLSRFERGEKTVSVAALMRISQALQSSIAALLGEQVSAETLHKVRRDERQYRAADNSNYEFAPLSRADDSGGPTALLLRMSADSVISDPAFHEGEELFFVLSGAIEIELGAQSTVLRIGDYAQFPGVVGHRLRGLEDNTQVLVVIS